MHRNVSAPSFAQSGGSSLDPFAEFMNSTARSNPNSGGSSAVNTPKQSRPNYSRAAFDSLNSSNTSAKSKVTPNAFEDLLSGHVSGARIRIFEMTVCRAFQLLHLLALQNRWLTYNALKKSRQWILYKLRYTASSFRFTSTSFRCEIGQRAKRRISVLY